jgi:protein ImuA
MMNIWSCKTSCQKGMNTFVPIATIDALRERIRCLEGRARHGRAVLRFGIKAIDEHLPEGGLALGALHEVAGGGNGAIDGAAAALFAAGIAARTRSCVLWCVTRQDLVRPGAGASRAGAGPGDLCRGWQREVSAGVFRRSAALPQAPYL